MLTLFMLHFLINPILQVKTLHNTESNKVNRSKFSLQWVNLNIESCMREWIETSFYKKTWKANKITNKKQLFKIWELQRRIKILRAWKIQFSFDDECGTESLSRKTGIFGIAIQGYFWHVNNSQTEISFTGVRYYIIIST